MKASLSRVQPLASQFTEWVAALDSRPREKQAAIGAAIVAGLFAWFGIALGSPVLLLAVPALGGLLYGGVRTNRRLYPLEDPIEISLERPALVPRPAVTPAPAPAPRPHEEPEDETPGDNLLSRISLAPPPPPVGRSSASYVYEPEPELIDALEEEPEEPRESGERFYEVCETVAGRSVVRHSSPSLFGATDYALELHTRSRGNEIEVVRVRGDARENVLRFSGDRPPEGSESAKSLLDLFGYQVTRWKGPGQA
jgi:hypothetical protein